MVYFELKFRPGSMLFLETLHKSSFQFLLPQVRIIWTLRRLISFSFLISQFLHFLSYSLCEKYRIVLVWQMGKILSHTILRMTDQVWKGKPEELNSQLFLQSFGSAMTWKTRVIFFTRSDLLCNIAVLLAQFKTNISLRHQIPQYIISTSLFWQVWFLFGGGWTPLCELLVKEAVIALKIYFRT